MGKDTLTLDRIKIADPCTTDWDLMAGNEQVRFCQHCARSVHNLSALTRREAEELVSKSRGRLCVKYYRRANGSIITAEDFPLHPARARVMSGAFAALLTLNYQTFGQAPAQSNPPPSPTVNLSIEKKRPDAGQPLPTTSIRGKVLAPDGAVIAGARVSISGQTQKRKLTGITNEQGEFEFASLTPDIYALEIAAEGFSDIGVNNLTLRPAEELRVDAQMRIGPLYCEVIEIRGGAISSSADIGTLGINRRGFWRLLYEIIIFPYRQGKKVFIR